MFMLIIYLIIILFKYKNNTLEKEWTQCNLDCCCCSVAKSCLTVWIPIDCSTPGSSVLHYLPEFAQIHIHRVGGWLYVIISSSAASSLLPSVFPFSGVFSNELALHIRWSRSIGASPSELVLPVNIQGWFPCSPRDYQESFPTLQFKGINSLELSLNGPILTSIHDYWKNRSFD